MNEESVNNLETAEPEEITEEEIQEEESAKEPEVAEPEDKNAVFADMRRRAEAEAQRKMDMRIANMCKGVKHPVTGKDITSWDEYEDAVAAQQRMQAESALKENNVDPNVLDTYISNSPVMRQAQAVIEQNRAMQADAQVRADIEMISTIDPTIKSVNDLAALPTFNNMLARVQNGISLVDAYKLENYDSLISRENQSARQAAINQARGKSHLEPTDSIAGESDSLDIPQEDLAAIKEAFPGRSMKELNKLYNQVYRRKT